MINKNIVEIEPVFILEKNGKYNLTFYSLVLLEMEGDREISIDIGDVEATTLFITMNEDLYPKINPDIYDVMIENFNKFNIEILGGLLISKDKHIWNCQLELFNTYTKETVYSNIKASDLICLCIKLGLPIFVNEEYLKLYDADEEKEKKEKEKKYSTKEELEKLLQTLVENEEYEEASKIKEKIDKLNIL